MNYISFPGLGIEPFHIDRAAFSVFGHEVMWYGILITLGMVLCVLYANYVGVKREKLESDLIIDLAFFIIVFGVAGARLYYVIFEWDSYLVNSGDFLYNLGGTLKNVLNIRGGGLAIYGGIIGGLITAYIFARVRKVSFIKLFDILGSTVLIGQIIGRWGNFVNMEAHGGETTLPWRMGLHYSWDGSAIETGLWDREIFVHPTFLYESLWNLIGFVILFSAYKKKKFDGQIFAMYLIWYGFGRMLIEGLRTDSLYLGSFRISQLVGALSLLLGLAIVILNVNKLKIAAADAVSYDSVYDRLNSNLAEEKPESAETEEAGMNTTENQTDSEE